VIEAVAGIGLVRTVHAVAVYRAGPGVGQVAVPDLVGVLGHLEAVDLLPALDIEQQSSTLVALAEKRAKLTPSPSQVAPNGMAGLRAACF